MKNSINVAGVVCYKIFVPGRWAAATK